MSNHAVRISQFSAKYDTISYDEVPLPELKEGEALVNMILRPINPSDAIAPSGHYLGFQPKNFPATLGFEGLGKVVKSNGKLSEGQRVIYLDVLGKGRNFTRLHLVILLLYVKHVGTYQEYVAVPEEFLIPVPDDITDAQAASFWVNPVTVVGMLKTLDVPKGKYVIQSAAGSALGRMVIAVGKHWGIKTLNLVRREEQVEELKALGADHVFVSSSGDDLASKVQEITNGEGAWGALDSVGGATTKDLVRNIRNGGSVLIYGALSGLELSASIPDLLFKNKVIRGFWLSLYLKSVSKEDIQAIVKDNFDLMRNKVISDYIGKTFPLKDAALAMKASTEAGRGGKVYLTN